MLDHYPPEIMTHVSLSNYDSCFSIRNRQISVLLLHSYKFLYFKGKPAHSITDLPPYLTVSLMWFLIDLYFFFKYTVKSFVFEKLKLQIKSQ